MNALTVRDLSKRYRGGTLANDRISLSVAPGEVYALLGPNGAGKTTLVRQVLGLLKPTSGAIAVHGVDVVANPGFARRNVGFLPQGQFHMEMARIGEVIHSMARLRGLPTAEAKRRAEAVIARLDLEEFRKTPHFTASGGVKRLCGLASAIVGGQKVLVLDEPTNDVDPVRRQLLWGLLAELRADGAAILLVTHNLAEVDINLHFPFAPQCFYDHTGVSPFSPQFSFIKIFDQLRIQAYIAQVKTNIILIDPDRVTTFYFTVLNNCQCFQGRFRNVQLPGHAVSRACGKDTKCHFAAGNKPGYQGNSSITTNSNNLVGFNISYTFL